MSPSETVSPPPPTSFRHRCKVQEEAFSRCFIAFFLHVFLKTACRDSLIFQDVVLFLLFKLIS